MYKDFILCKYEEKKDISPIQHLTKKVIDVISPIIAIICVLGIILRISGSYLQILSLDLDFIIRVSFALVITLFLFKQKSFYNEVYMCFDENKNIVLVEIDEENEEKIVEIIPEDEIKSFTYKNFCGRLCINFYKRKSFEISLEHLEKETQARFVNTIIHNYVHKITPKVVDKISNPHQRVEHKNVLILTIIGILIIVAIIVFAIIF